MKSSEIDRRPEFAVAELEAEMAERRSELLMSAGSLLGVIESNETILATEEGTFLQAPSNPTTGYQWLIDTSSCPDGLDVLANHVEKPQGDVPVMGAPGATLFEFYAWEPEVECDVRAVYARSWMFSWDVPSNSDEIATFKVKSDL